MVDVDLLEGVGRYYELGSPTAIPELLGQPATGEPVAELWLGAHPSGPARLGAEGRPLDELIDADPIAALGPDVADRFGCLPFLFKVIAAAEPLSLQAHPNADQAVAGYAREDAAGIPLDAPERFFRDRSHKPELVCALSSFEALCGFRDAVETLELLATIETAALDPVRDRLRQAPDRDGLGEALEWLLTLEEKAAVELVSEVSAACHDPGPDLGRVERNLALDLAARHPSDAAVVTALLLNHVRLAPGEAAFFNAGTLHCYLGGMGVELMANSDNVLRGGLTAKPIDVAALIEIVDTAPATPAVQRPPVVNGVAEYVCPVPEFSLHRLEIGGYDRIVIEGPAVLLCIDGVIEAGSQTLDRGSAAWIGASEPPVALWGRGTAFRAGVGDFALH